METFLHSLKITYKSCSNGTNLISIQASIQVEKIPGLLSVSYFHHAFRCHDIVMEWMAIYITSILMSMKFNSSRSNPWSDILDRSSGGIN
jgi:hypothetical protein